MKIEQQHVNGSNVSNPTEYQASPKRRTFSNTYKREILDKAASCTGRGEVGALLRKEGLYSSHLTDWRRQDAKGELSGNASSKRGRKTVAKKDELAELRRENAKMARKLEQAEYIIDAQKKLALALEQTLTEAGGKN